jgi:alkylation response protein AidB-like acyl-CoA dehydrogenase
MTASYGSDSISQELAGGLREFFDDRCGLDHVRSAWAHPHLDTQLWQEVAELGVIGVLGSEEAGGLDVQPGETVLAIEEVGYSGASLPLTDTLAVVVPILERCGNPEQKRELLPGLISGELVGAFGGAYGTFAADADVVLFEDGDDVHVLKRGQFAVRAVHTPDAAASPGRIEPVDGALQESPGLGTKALAQARVNATWASAALLNGVSRRMLDMTVEHAKTREQFGRLIGSFQAVKHLLADVWVAVESARPCSWYAADISDGNPATAAAAASVAKAAASEAARVAGDAALQVHGGIGFTWEHPLHFWMKRAKALESAHGSQQFHLRRLGSMARNTADWKQIIFAET